MNPDDNRTDILSYYGVPLSFSWTLTDDAGTPYPLTGKKGTAHVRNGTPDNPGSIAITVSTTAGNMTFNTGTGAVTIALTATNMQLAVGDYWTELLILDGSSVPVARPAWGYWQHRPTGLEVA